MIGRRTRRTCVGRAASATRNRGSDERRRPPETVGRTSGVGHPKPWVGRVRSTTRYHESDGGLQGDRVAIGTLDDEIAGRGLESERAAVLAADVLADDRDVVLREDPAADFDVSDTDTRAVL